MRYRIAGFELDLRQCELRNDGKIVPAEPQVLSLLFHLVEHRDRLVTKDELIAAVWGGRAVCDSAISSRIKSARHLLGDDGDRQHMIRTIHGKGFRFVGDVVDDPTPQGNGPVQLLGDKPSVAVLPFTCSDPSLLILSDGVSHELIVGLSHLHSLKVIARGSSFRFRNWQGDFTEVSRALAVQYCLTGSIHRVGNNVAATVELIDARTDAVIWGGLYEQHIEELHGIRQKIVQQVVSSLELHISHRESELAQLRPAEDLTAWACYHLGLQHIFRFNKTDNSQALGYFEQAVAIDPGLSQAHAGVSSARFQNAFMRYSDDVDNETLLARRAAEAAVELDEQDATANLMLGRTHWLEGNIEGSLPWLERAIMLCPNYAQAIYAKAWAHMILCEGQIGQQNAREAIQLSPIDPLRYAMIAIDGFTQSMMGEEDSGAMLVDRAAREPRAHVMIAIMAAICQVWAGDTERTDYWRREIKLRRDNLTGENFLRSFPFVRGELRNRVTDALVAIGI